MRKLFRFKRLRRGGRSRVGNAALFVVMIALSVLMIAPLVYSVINSFKPLDELWVFPPRFFVVNPTFKNFTDLFKLMGDSWVPFSRYIFNTAFISVVGTAGNVLFSAYAAYAIAKIPFPGRNFLFKIVVYSLMFNSTVTGITNFITMSALGWVDTYFAVIVPAFCTTFGLYLMKQFMEQLPDTLLEAAEIDGAGEWTKFWHIAMPNVKSAWLTLIVFSVQSLWNISATNFVYREEIKPLGVAFTQAVASGTISRAGVSAAVTVVMMSVPIVVFLFTQSRIIETMTTSGIKE